MYLPAPDLHHVADRNRFVAAEVEHAFEDKIGIQSRGTKGRSVTGLKGKREQCPRIESSMVISITWQDQAMSQGFESWDCIWGMRVESRGI